jgi:hypothetical protein
MLVPAFQGSASLRLTFYNSAGTNLGTAQTASLTLPSNRCDPTGNGSADAADAQYLINEALGLRTAADDLNGDGRVNVVDVQIVIESALGLGCTAQ